MRAGFSLSGEHPLAPSLSLSLSLSGVKLGFLPSQMTGQAGKKFISLLGGGGGHSLAAQRLGPITVVDYS